MNNFEAAAAATADTIYGTELLDLEYCWEQIDAAVDIHAFDLTNDLARWYKVMAREAHALLATQGSAAQMADVARLVSAKQRDYGPQNILKFGHEGLRVRLWDKVARYQNLTSKTDEAVYESIEDTLMDIIGYCIIGLMLLDGTFELPLRDDNVLPFSPRLKAEMEVLEKTPTAQGWDVT